MSLLLDALNRASKEKQKVAAAAAQAQAPSAQAVPEAPSFSLASGPVEPLKWEDLAKPTPAAQQAATADAPRAAPPVLTTPVLTTPVQADAELELTLVDAPPAAAPTPTIEPPPRLEAYPRTEAAPLVLVTTELVREPTLEPRPAETLAPAAPEPAVSTPREPTLEAPVAPAQPVVSVQAPAPAPSEPVPASPPPPPPVVAAAPVPPVVSPVGLAAASTAKSVSDGQAAQDIRRAYEGPTSNAGKGRRRVMALGGLAIGLALAFGSVFLGLWGDPAKWMGGTGLSTVTPPTAVANQEPAAPAVPAAPTEPVALGAVPTTAAPVAVAPAATPPTSVTAPASTIAPLARSSNTRPNASTLATGNEVVLSTNARTNPTFVANTRAPSALEHGYALLLEGRLDDAAAAYSQALRANADERDALLGMAYISQQKDQRDDAQSYYRRVLRQEPNNTRALAALQALDSGSDATLTASRTGDLAARQPDSAVAMAMAGNAFVRDGLLSNAAQAYARAQSLEPTNPLHAYNHAVALDRLGQYGPAVVQYERVLALSATAPVAGRAYQIGDVRLRLAQLRQALAASTESAAP